MVAMDSPIVQATQRAVSVITRGPRVTFAGSSTDSNLAMSLGIPAVTIGGGDGGNWHSRNEWYKPVDAYFGPQNALFTILMLTGLDGVTKPALAVRQGK
jgi:acetylornithine deacetylase/succinyl-diaminopimelate desuccinylase-like protein